MKKLGFTMLVAMIGGMVSAGTVVREVALDFAMTDANRTLTITYDLARDSIITLDILTKSGDDWTSIGCANFGNASGAVNKLVTAGSGRTITWPARLSWPDHKVAAGELKAVVTAWSPSDPPDYLVVDLTGAKDHRYYASADDFPDGFGSRVYKTSKLVMKRVHAKGVHATLGRSPRYDDTIENYWWKTNGNQSPNAEVPWLCTFTNDFYMGIYEVTQSQFTNMYSGTACSVFIGANFPDADLQPVDAFAANGPKGAIGVLRYGNSNDVLYKDYVKYRWPQDGHSVAPTSVLGELQTNTGLEFDLPTSAEWEFTCRAGTRWAVYSGPYTSLDQPSQKHVTALDDIGWFNFNCTNAVTQLPSTHPVGLKTPNAWGFYDMLGNVSECCRDWHENNNPADGIERIDPPGPEFANSSSRKQIRVCGSSCLTSNIPYYGRIASKMSAINNTYGFDNGGLGFRLWLGIK